MAGKNAKPKNETKEERQEATVPEQAAQQSSRVPTLGVKIDRLYNYEESKVKAAVSVNIGGAYAIHGIRVMESDKGQLFVAMPSRSYSKDGEIKYSDLFHPTTAEARNALNNTILQVYEKALSEQESQGQGIEETEAPEMEEGGISQTM